MCIFVKLVASKVRNVAYLHCSNHNVLPIAGITSGRATNRADIGDETVAAMGSGGCAVSSEVVGGFVVGEVSRAWGLKWCRRHTRSGTC